MEIDFVIFLCFYFVTLTFVILNDMGLNSKKIKNIFLFLLLIIILVLLIQWGNYKYNYISKFMFNSMNLKEDNMKLMQSYGLMGDYIGGVWGTFLTFCAVLLSVIGVVIAIWNNNSQIETQLDIAELNKYNIKCQNKPFLYVNFELDGNTNFSVDLKNVGIGPLEFKYIRLVSSEVVYENNFLGLFRAIRENMGVEQFHILRTYFHSDSKIMLGIGDSINICFLNVDAVNNTRLLFPMAYFLNELSKFKLECNFIDIFGNEYPYSKDLSFLKERYSLDAILD